jgi:hypothetical protein
VALVHQTTGLDEDSILWDLPLARGMSYMHVAYILQGNETQWPSNGQEGVVMAGVRKMLKDKPWRKLDT